MPNWCNNTLTIVCASKEEADDLHNHIETYEKEEKAFFDFFVPQPEFEPNESDAMPDWYFWRVNNWGTKWDASMHHVEWMDDYTVVLAFDTAWGPPIEVYEAADEQGYQIYATYYEPGMCFVGSWNVGEAEHYEYSECDTPDEIRELVGDDLDDEYGISDWFREYQEEEAMDEIVEPE